MKAELQEELFKKYPKLFRQRKLPMTETCMCWGIDTGDGWYNLIDALCRVIAQRDENVEATQVKEKFGGLRFYVDKCSEYINGAIWLAESLSNKTCESCGGVGTQRPGGWVQTLCEPCNKEQEEFQEERRKEVREMIDKRKAENSGRPDKEPS